MKGAYKMKIVDVSSNLLISNNDDEVLIVAMTQEEYQLACQAVLNNRDKECKNERPNTIPKK